MDRVVCHVLRYSSIALHIVYYTIHGMHVALAYHNNTWHILTSGVNVITPTIDIDRSDSSFTVVHNGRILSDDYYNHESFDRSDLPLQDNTNVSAVHVTQNFEKFLDLNDSTPNAYAMYILILIFVLLFIGLTWLLK